MGDTSDSYTKTFIHTYNRQLAIIIAVICIFTVSFMFQYVLSHDDMPHYPVYIMSAASYLTTATAAIAALLFIK